MQTHHTIQATLDEIAYKNWWFLLLTGLTPDWTLQVSFETIDVKTGSVFLQSGRKWRLSRHMTKSEIVQTALMAVLAAEEHEAREQFKFRGRAIFGPHLDVEALALFVTANQTDERTPPT